MLKKNQVLKLIFPLVLAILFQILLPITQMHMSTCLAKITLEMVLDRIMVFVKQVSVPPFSR